MPKNLFTVVTIAAILCAASPAAAQAPKTPEPTPPPPALAVAPQPRLPAQLMNIRIDLTISVTDQKNSPPTLSKLVTLHVNDRNHGRIRMGFAANSGAGSLMDTHSPVLNVDASPEILRDGRIRVDMSFEFRPTRSSTDQLEPLHINERVGTILEDGKPFLLTQTPDPSSDRVVKVEMKATILK